MAIGPSPRPVPITPVTCSTYARPFCGPPIRSSIQRRAERRRRRNTSDTPFRRHYLANLSWIQICGDHWQRGSRIHLLPFHWVDERFLPAWASAVNDNKELAGEPQLLLRCSDSRGIGESWFSVDDPSIVETCLLSQETCLHSPLKEGLNHGEHTPPVQVARPDDRPSS